MQGGKEMERVNRILRHEGYGRHLRENQAAEEGRIFCRHDLGHFLDVARIAMILNLREGLEIPRDMIYGAALLHDIGRHEQYETGVSHETASARIARDILADCGYRPEEIEEIAGAIAGHRDGDNSARRDLAGLLYLADKASRPCFACPASGQCHWSEEKKNLELSW